MYIGLGIFLIVVGLILALDVITVDIGYVNEGALGAILILAGIAAVALSFFIAPPWRGRTVVTTPGRRSTTVQERYDEGPLP